MIKILGTEEASMSAYQRDFFFGGTVYQSEKLRFVHFYFVRTFSVFIS
jgi:hypothetical protein